MTLTNTELHVPVRKNGEGTDRPKARKGVLRQAMFRPESKGRVELSWRTAWGGACGLTGSSRKGPVVGGYVRWHGQRAEGQEELRRRCSSTCYLADRKQSPTPKLHVGTPLLPGSSGWAARPSRGGRLCSPSPWPLTGHLGGISPVVYLSALLCLFCSQDQRALGRVWGQGSREAVTRHRWGRGEWAGP